MSTENNPYLTVPDYGQLNQNFGKEKLYSGYTAPSAVSDLAAAAAAANLQTGARTPDKGKYVYDAKTGQYIWVPSSAAAAVNTGVAASPYYVNQNQDRGGGGGRDVDPTSNNSGYNPSITGLTVDENGNVVPENAKALSFLSMVPFIGTFAAAHLAAKEKEAKEANIAVESAKTNSNMAVNPMSKDPQQRAAENRGIAQAAAQAEAQAQAQAAAETNATTTNAAVSTGSNVTDPSQRGQAQIDAGNTTGGNTTGNDSVGPADGSGGGYGGDGDCVDPKTHVLLADGSEVQAGSLKVGDVVHTLHEDTFEYGDFEVVYAETIQQPKSIVKFTDGSEITTSLSHKFLLVDREWKRVDALKEGDAIETAPNVNAEGFKVVASLEQIGTGDVVKLTIDQAHTYISDGLVSHNKFARGGSIRMATGGLGDLGGYSDGGRLLRGPGDGVSDSIPANIGGKRPARLADGEFVIPARIVSELGNGSTDAGARKLYAMLDRIQAGRKKTVGKGKVATNSRSDKNLPA